VFDALGRRVAVLAAGYRAAGDHVVSFEAGGLPAGAYHYRLQVDGRATGRTMVLAR
jgi:hypothetical protein